MTSKRRNRSVTKDLCPLLIELQFGTISGNGGNDACLLQNCMDVFGLLSQGGWNMECVVTGNCLLPVSSSLLRNIHLNFMRIPCKAIEIDEEWFEGALPNHYGTKYRATAHRLSPLVVVRK